MNDWSTRSPGTTITRTYKGDINYAERFRGDGDNLLYVLKNQMSFNSLGQLRMARRFTDGTMITVSSYVNSITKVSKDSIHIDVSKSSKVGDCCKKSSNLRNVEAWWEKVPDGGGQSIRFGGMTLYKTPSEVLLTDLENYKLYTIPQVDGGCVDFTWAVNGDGTMAVAFQGLYAQYNPPTSPGEVGCPTPSITVQDRCGTQKTINITPCCDEDNYADPVMIYTSLMMTLSEEQTLEVTNGCAPFNWEIVSGGGTIVPTAENVPNPPYRKAVYTAPSSNPNCPPAVIQVTDCCGKEASISIAVTTDTAGLAYSIFEWFFYEVQQLSCVGGGQIPAYGYHVYENKYNCLGDYAGRSCLPPCIPAYKCNETWDPSYCQVFQIVECGIRNSSAPTVSDTWKCIPALSIYGKDPCVDCPCVISDAFGDPSVTQPREMCFSKKSDCPSIYNGYGASGYNPGYDGEVWDTRTADMIAAGCCPLNPETGLPF